MNEEQVVQPGLEMPVSNIRSDQSGEVEPTTAGGLLRDARLARGLDISTLAALLKVPVQKLQALEQNRLEFLPDAVFARALASSMCRSLSVDPLPVLERLPAIAAFKVTSQNRGINAPFRTRDEGHGPSVWSHFSRPAVLIGFSFLLGALILIFLPVVQQEITKYKLEKQGFVSKKKQLEAVSIATAAAGEAGANSDAAGIISVPPVGLAPTELSPLLSSAVVAPAVLLAANVAATQFSNTIAFSATGESWVNVTDAKGVSVLSRTLHAGESVGATGAMPLATVIGRADAIQVLVRGQAFSLGGVTKNNVARFEVK